MLTQQALSDFITPFMSSAQVPGLAYTIIHHGDVIINDGLGVTSNENPRPITPDTIFRIGSVSKPLTGALIMRLVDRHMLDLDTPISTYLSELSDCWLATVTLRELLSHTSGLPTGLTYWGTSSASALLAYVDELCQMTPIVPRGVYSYSNHGINLAAMVAETVTQAPYAELIQSEVFAPLNMTRATVDPLTAMTYPLALPHIPDETGNLQVLRPFIDHLPHRPCGFVMTTINDLAQFALMLMGAEYRDFLSADSRQQMITPHVSRYTVDQSHYGLTTRQTRYRGVQIIGHNGAIGKYGGWLWIEPQTQSGFVMLVNRAPQFWGYAAKIMHHVWDALLTFPIVSTQPIKSSAQPIAGTYRGLDVGLVQIESSGDQFTCAINGGEATLISLHHIADDGTPVYQVQPDGVSLAWVHDGLTVNGAYCQRIDYTPHTDQPDAQLQGVYRADIDTLIFRIEDETLFAYSVDDRQDYRLFALSATEYAGEIGLLRWTDSGIHWGSGYFLTPVTD